MQSKLDFLILPMKVQNDTAVWKIDCLFLVKVNTCHMTQAFHSLDFMEGK